MYYNSINYSAVNVQRLRELLPGNTELYLIMGGKNKKMFRNNSNTSTCSVRVSIGDSWSKRDIPFKFVRLNFDWSH